MEAPLPLDAMFSLPGVGSWRTSAKSATEWMLCGGLLRVDHHHVGHARHHGDRYKSFAGRTAYAYSSHLLMDWVPTGAHQQGVAVVGGLGHQVRMLPPAPEQAVVHHELLAECPWTVRALDGRARMSVVPPARKARRCAPAWRPGPRQFRASNVPPADAPAPDDAYTSSGIPWSLLRGPSGLEPPVTMELGIGCRGQGLQHSGASCHRWRAGRSIIRAAWSRVRANVQRTVARSGQPTRAEKADGAAVLRSVAPVRRALPGHDDRRLSPDLGRTQDRLGRPGAVR